MSIKRRGSLFGRRRRAGVIIASLGLGALLSVLVVTTRSDSTTRTDEVLANEITQPVTSRPSAQGSQAPPSPGPDSSPSDGPTTSSPDQSPTTTGSPAGPSPSITTSPSLPGVPPTVSASATALDFGSITEFTQTSRTLNLSFSGGTSGQSVSETFSLIGPQSGNFTTFGCSGLLKSGSSCSLTVFFKPREAGVIGATLNIASSTSSGQGAGSASVALTGQASAPPPLLMSLVPTSLGGFPFVGMFESTSQTLEIKVTGGVPGDRIAISEELAFNDAGTFSLDTSACDAGIVPGSSCTIFVVYTGLTCTTQTAELRLSATDPISGQSTQKKLFLTGSGSGVC